MKKILPVIFCLITLSAFLQNCSGHQDNTIQAPVHVSENMIHIRPDSKFMEQLHIISLSGSRGEEQKLKTVGQIVAMANLSGNLARNGISWVTLDPAVIRTSGLSLSESARAGISYGITTVNSNYINEIHRGEQVIINRYGVKHNSVTGNVVSIRKTDGSENENCVIFVINHENDLYPGTNCQVEFPLVRRQSVALSPLSMVHEGLNEYVLKEISPGKYKPVKITVVSESTNKIYAIGDLSGHDRVIERGAILLKPVVHQLFESLKEATHAQ